MKILKYSLIVLSVIIGLLIITALITPPIAKNYIVKNSKELVGRQINIKGLYLNIFTGYLRITDFQLLEKEGEEIFVAFDTLSVDVSLYKLLANELKVNHIYLINPDVSFWQRGEYFNFDDLLALGEADSQTAEEEPIDSLVKASEKEGMAIALYDIKIQGGHIRYEDMIRKSVWEMESFGLDIPGIYFKGKNTDVDVSLDFNNGGHLRTVMQYNMEAGDYLLNISLSDFAIDPIKPYLLDFMNINTVQGMFTTNLNIKGSMEHVMDLTLSGDIGLRHFLLTDNQDNKVFATDSILIEMENINPEKEIFHFKTISIDGIDVAFEMDNDGNTITNILKEQEEQPESEPAVESVKRGSDVMPDLKIETFRVNNSHFIFKDRTLHTPFVFAIDHIHMEADNLTLSGKNKAKVSSKLKNGGTITFNWEGKMDDIRNTDLFLGIKNLDLKQFTPYTLQYFGYPMNKGVLTFNSENRIKNFMLNGKNNLNIAKCEVGDKRKDLKPEYNIPLKTALYIIKDVNGQIKMDLPVKGNVNSPDFSYKKIIIKTLTNLLVKVAVSPLNFLANSMGISSDKLKDIPFKSIQLDFTEEQLVVINQLAEIIKMKPEMTLVLEQFINPKQNEDDLALWQVKRDFYLKTHKDKTEEMLLPTDYYEIEEIGTRDEDFVAYLNKRIEGEMRDADFDAKIHSLVDAIQIETLTTTLVSARNQALADYLQRLGVPQKNIRISSIAKELQASYTGKSCYKINMILEGDEPDPELIPEE